MSAEKSICNNCTFDRKKNDVCHKGHIIGDQIVICPDWKRKQLEGEFCGKCRFYRINLCVHESNEGKTPHCRDWCENFEGGYNSLSSPAHIVETSKEKPWENQLKQCDACKYYTKEHWCDKFKHGVEIEDLCNGFEWAEEEETPLEINREAILEAVEIAKRVVSNTDTYAQGFADGHREGLAQLQAEDGTPKQILKVCLELNHFLREKNRRYGDSALNPIGVFAKDGAAKGLYLRADDKVSRIKNSPELRKNDVVDLMGYLVLICIEHGWVDWRDQID